MMPRANCDYYSIKTDTFTRGINSSLHLQFTDLDPVEDEDETQKRFGERRFPLWKSMKMAILSKNAEHGITNRPMILSMTCRACKSNQWCARSTALCMSSC